MNVGRRASNWLGRPFQIRKSENGIRNDGGVSGSREGAWCERQGASRRFVEVGLARMGPVASAAGDVARRLKPAEQGRGGGSSIHQLKLAADGEPAEAGKRSLSLAGWRPVHWGWVLRKAKTLSRG
jgi:hypothetical protein